MPKMIFVNLPVVDMARSVRFYEAIGFTRDTTFGDGDGRAAMMRWSDAICFNLHAHDFYGTFTDKPIADAHATSAVLLCLSCDDRQAVDTLIDAAVAHGGREARPRHDGGFMYGGAVEDPDGHVIEPMWMDVDAAVAAMSPAQAA